MHTAALLVVLLIVADNIPQSYVLPVGKHAVCVTEACNLTASVSCCRASSMSFTASDDVDATGTLAYRLTSLNMYEKYPTRP